jgi:hypothetical protein
MTSWLTPFLIGCLIGFSLILLIVSLISYRRAKNPRLLLVSAALLIFLIKGILLLVWMVLLTTLAESAELFAIILLDFLILIFLYFAIAKN